MDTAWYYELGIDIAAFTEVSKILSSQLYYTTCTHERTHTHIYLRCNQNKKKDNSNACIAMHATILLHANVLRLTSLSY